MFSYRLSRLPYAVLMYIDSFWSMQRILEGGRDDLILVLATSPLLLVFVIWPRLRDCDWPLWFGFLLIIPLLGSLMGIALLFAPSKVFGRKEDAIESPPVDLGLKQIAGSRCARCGNKIIMAAEGALQGEEVVCTQCQGTTPG